MDGIDDLVAEVREQRKLPAVARATRRKAGVSQARMAAALGVDRTTLARWELGRIQPRPAQRQRWQELLDKLEREVAA
jgi:transcriptional regulator with XRE-family HTH domain